MEIFIRNHDQVNRVLWLNSLPPRFKKEIIDKLIEEGIDLSINDQYKIMVDFGTISIMQNSGTPKQQTTLERSPIAESSCSRQQRYKQSQSPLGNTSQSPIRVTVEHIKKSQTNFIDLAKKRKKMLSRADKARMTLDAEYEEYLNLTVKPNDEVFAGVGKKNKIPFVPSQQAAKKSESRSRLAQTEMERKRKIRDSQISRLRSEVQDSWKEFTQSVVQQSTSGEVDGKNGADADGLGNRGGTFQVQLNRPPVTAEGVPRHNSTSLLQQTQGPPAEEESKNNQKGTKLPELAKTSVVSELKTLEFVASDAQSTLQPLNSISGEGPTEDRAGDLVNVDDHDANADSSQQMHDEYSALYRLSAPPKPAAIGSAKNMKKVVVLDQTDKTEMMSRNTSRLGGTAQVVRGADMLTTSLQKRGSAGGNKRQVIHSLNASNRASFIGINSSDHPGSLDRRSNIMRNSASSITEEKGGQTHFTHSQTLEFNAESYAAKKKLLQYMITALESARQTRDLQELKAKARDASASPQMRADTRGHKKRKSAYNGNESRFQDSMTAETPAVANAQLVNGTQMDGRRTTLATPKNHGIQRGIGSVTGSNLARCSQDYSAVENTIDGQDQDLAIEQKRKNLSKFMMNTIDQSSKQRMLRGFKKLRKIQMPKPKTIQQIIKDHETKKSSQLLPTFPGIRPLENIDQSMTSDAIEHEQRMTAINLKQFEEINALVEKDKERGDETIFGERFGANEKNNVDADLLTYLDSQTKQDKKGTHLFEFQPQTASLRPNTQTVKNTFKRQLDQKKESTLTLKDTSNNPRESIKTPSMTTKQQVVVKKQFQGVSVQLSSGMQEMESSMGMKKPVYNALSTEFMSEEQATLNRPPSIEGVNIQTKQSESSMTRKTEMVKFVHQAVNQTGPTVYTSKTDVTRPVTRGSMPKKIEQLRHQAQKQIFIPQTVTRLSQDSDTLQNLAAQSSMQTTDAFQGGHQIQVIKRATQEQSPESRGDRGENYDLENKQSQSAVNGRKMMTINYFGNIQDQLIGQIKTKIPLQDKIRSVKTFHSPPRQTYQATDTIEERKMQTIPRRDSSQNSPENSDVFYANIGKEPYIVNKCFRPKGLSSFKPPLIVNEEEIHFQKRKGLFQMEQDMKIQHEINRNQIASIRGSMIRDIKPQNLKGAPIGKAKRQVSEGHQSREFAPLKTSSSQPAFLNQRSSLGVGDRQFLLTRGQKGHFMEQGSRIMQKSKSRKEILVNKDEDSPYRHKQKYLQEEEQDFLKLQQASPPRQINEMPTDLVSRDTMNSPATPFLGASVKYHPTIELPSIGETANTGKELITEFLKKENSLGLSTPQMQDEITESKYNNGREKTENKDLGMIIKISSPQNKRAGNYRDSELHKTGTFGDQNKNSMKTPAFPTDSSDKATLKFGNSSEKRVVHSSLGFTQMRNSLPSSFPAQQNQLMMRESAYTSLSTIPDGLGAAAAQDNIKIETNSPLATQMNTTKKTSKSRSKSRGQTKVNRSLAMSQTMKFGKMNASAFAHSQAEQIKSFVKMSHPTQVPNLLNRGAERYLGKSQMFKGLSTSTKNKKIFDKCAGDQVTDIPLQSKRDKDDAERMFQSISRLSRKPNEAQVKHQAFLNQQEFKNPVAFAQRLIEHRGNLLNSQMDPVSKDDEYQRFGGADGNSANPDQGEIYLRFLRYKNQKAKDAGMKTIE